MTASIIDIGMTACNAAWSLPDTLASVAGHAVRDIRPVAADDGSTGATPPIPAQAAADPRIRLPTGPNGGIVAAVRHRTVSGSGSRAG